MDSGHFLDLDVTLMYNCPISISSIHSGSGSGSLEQNSEFNEKVRGSIFSQRTSFQKRSPLREWSYVVTHIIHPFHLLLDNNVALQSGTEPLSICFNRSSKQRKTRRKCTINKDVWMWGSIFFIHSKRSSTRTMASTRAALPYKLSVWQQHLREMLTALTCYDMTRINNDLVILCNAYF